jgi:hypothetical protein
LIWSLASDSSGFETGLLAKNFACVLKSCQSHFSLSDLDMNCRFGLLFTFLAHRSLLLWHDRLTVNEVFDLFSTLNLNFFDARDGGNTETLTLFDTFCESLFIDLLESGWIFTALSVNVM